MYQTLIVVDSQAQLFEHAQFETVSFDSYLNDYGGLSQSKKRIINLCNTARYLSKGYYCSLLAEAREHAVLPSVKTINALRHLNSEEGGLLSFRQEDGFLAETTVPLEVIVYFGWTENAAVQKLAKKIFNDYPAPILKLSLLRETGALRLRVERCAFSALSPDQREGFIKKLTDYSARVWRPRSRRKSYRWELAILVNPHEKVPPSDKKAIARFVSAAEKYGIHAETVTAEQFQNPSLALSHSLSHSLSKYDALFIRETTQIDHPTYRLACQAESSGVVVIDDPTSILRCCNKVYLHSAFDTHDVPSLRTLVVKNEGESSMAAVEQAFTYPLVLKMPEGSFSNGIYKVNSRTELQDRLLEMFKLSALVLAQEYFYTEFDWRIGVLNGRAIYACRYLMARDHWQIYNYGSKRYFSGDFETLPTFEVPKVVLEVALKSANIIGRGLYGVDIKQLGQQAFVIEVNDNPSIEHKVEDAYLGDELYGLIIAEFQRRLEERGRRVA